MGDLKNYLTRRLNESEAVTKKPAKNKELSEASSDTMGHISFDFIGGGLNGVYMDDTGGHVRAQLTLYSTMKNGTYINTQVDVPKYDPDSEEYQAHSSWVRGAQAEILSELKRVFNTFDNKVRDVMLKYGFKPSS